MSEEQKLDFALKYSSDDYIKKLPNIVSAWERVTDLILAREENMRKLEIFEKEASDPNRFFERGEKIQCQSLYFFVHVYLSCICRRLQRFLRCTVKGSQGESRLVQETGKNGNNA